MCIRDSSRTDHFTLDNISSENIDYRKLYEGLKLGNHLVSIDSVKDNNGCSNELLGEDNQISISVTDVPRISLTDNSMEYCVGDYVGYQLSGVAPVSYTHLDVYKRQMQRHCNTTANILEINVMNNSLYLN